jgi:hypothetical protein
VNSEATPSFVTQGSKPERVKKNSIRCAISCRPSAKQRCK